MLASSIAFALISNSVRASQLEGVTWIGNTLQLQLDEPTQAQLYVDPQQPRLILDLIDTKLGELDTLQNALRSHPAVVDAQAISDTSRSRIVFRLNQPHTTTLDIQCGQLKLQLDSNPDEKSRY
jgi:hypothetical protein